MKKSAPNGKVRFPVIVERGPTGLKGKATIHWTPATVGGERYDSYTVIFYTDGKRQRQRFSDYAKAYAKAEEVATKRSNGESEALSLSGDDRRRYVDALNLLRDSETVSLDLAVREYAEARKILGEVSLRHAVDFYERHGRTVIKKGSLQDILDEMLAALQADKRSEYHVRDVKRYIGAFIRHFDCDIGEITTPQINDWLRKLGGSGRTRDNHRDAVHNFFGFARAEAYLPKDLPHAAHGTKRVNEAGAENEVFSVDEAQKLLRGAPAWLIPCLAMKLFCGIRTQEMLRIEWEDIKFEQDVIFLSKKVTKTKRRRIVPLLPNLKQWLAPYVGSSGRIAARWVSAQTLSKSWTDRAKKVGVKYKKNAMRNSYVSYRVAVVANVAQVAIESGNSPGVIQENYLELVTQAEAQKWFSISPEEGTT